MWEYNSFFHNLLSSSFLKWVHVSLACLEAKLWPIEHMMEKCYIMEHNIYMQLYNLYIN